MTKIMGIVNVTPDSFYDGGKHSTTESAVAHGLKLIEEGVDILDIGGESTRPGSTPITVEEELERVIPVIKAIKEKSSIPLSIDTMKPEVALKAVEAGANTINDVSGFRNPKMRTVAAESGATLCLMHMQGTPQTMQQNPHYPGGVVDAIVKWLDGQISLLLKEGVEEKKIIVDPGICFGKTVADNYEMLQNIPRFRSLGFPLLIGISRKSFLSKITGKSPDSAEVLAATLVVNALMIKGGVDIIRVHDVKAHRHIINVLESSP